MADTRRALTPDRDPDLQWRRALDRQAGSRHSLSARVDGRAPAGATLGQVPEPADLEVLKDLVEAGKVTPVIGGTYPLAETAKAIGHVAGGHARGTLVIAVTQPSNPEAA